MNILEFLKREGVDDPEAWLLNVTNYATKPLRNILRKGHENTKVLASRIYYTGWDLILLKRGRLYRLAISINVAAYYLGHTAGRGTKPPITAQALYIFSDKVFDWMLQCCRLENRGIDMTSFDLRDWMDAGTPLVKCWVDPEAEKIMSAKLTQANGVHREYVGGLKLSVSQVPMKGWQDKDYEQVDTELQLERGGRSDSWRRYLDREVNVAFFRCKGGSIVAHAEDLTYFSSYSYEEQRAIGNVKPRVSNLLKSGPSAVLYEACVEAHDKVAYVVADNLMKSTKKYSSVEAEQQDYTVIRVTRHEPLTGENLNRLKAQGAAYMLEGGNVGGTSPQGYASTELRDRLKLCKYRIVEPSEGWQITDDK